MSRAVARREKGRVAMMDGWNMTGWGWGWMTLMMGGGLLLLVLLVLLLTRGTATDTRQPAPPEDPKDILARRFAHGEIDEAEYRRRLDAVQAGPQRSQPSPP